MKDKLSDPNNLKFKAGRGYKLPLVPSQDLLDPIPLHNIPDPIDGLVTFTSSELTSLCPLTSQPDWATLIITIQPKRHTLETKSLKLYLHAFRSYKGFAESINLKILNDIFETINPISMKVDMTWNKRGGIAIQTSFGRRADDE